MVKQMENVCDRELFSELFDNPINPSLLHMVPPFVNQNDPMYYIQLNGEVAFKWQEVYHYPRTAFQLLQQSIAPLQYHEQWLPISHLFSNYALSLIDAKNVRPIVAHNAGVTADLDPPRIWTSPVHIRSAREIAGVSRF